MSDWESQGLFWESVVNRSAERCSRIADPLRDGDGVDKRLIIAVAEPVYVGGVSCKWERKAKPQDRRKWLPLSFTSGPHNLAPAS